MEKISENIKSLFLKEFKTEKKLNNIFENKEYYKLNNFTSNQIFKILNLKQQTIFSEINSKKHLNKVIEMIRTHFSSKKTNHYFDIFFQITNNEKDLKNRVFNFNNLSEKINIEKIKKIISNLNNLNTKISFNNSIITLDSNYEKILFDKYKISATYMNKTELNTLIENEINQDTIIISDEDLYIDIPVYKFKEFQKLIIGNIIKTNKILILNLLDFLDEISKNTQSIQSNIEKISEINFNIELDSINLKKILNRNDETILKDLTDKTLRLENSIEDINKKIKNIISKKKLSFEGDELLNLLNTGDLSLIQKKFKNDTKLIIENEEKEILNYYKNKGIKLNYIFSNNNYPLNIDEETKNEILKKIDLKNQELEYQIYSELGNFKLSQIKELLNFIYFFDLINGINEFKEKFNLNYIKFSNEITLYEGKNIYIKNPMPINYSVGGEKINDIKLKKEKICILTGANSGGKTTLLEMNLQSQILNSMGLGIPGNKKSTIKLFDEIIYLKKFTGTQGSGAFEQTIRNLIEILDSKTSKLILIDEFEAVTEPGAAARILIMFLEEIQNQNSFCIAASHLGQEIQEFIKKRKIEGIRIDGISAEGLDEKGNLITNHQPQFGKLGKSTPELILKRIILDNKFWNKKNPNSKKLLEKIMNL